MTPVSTMLAGDNSRMIRDSSRVAVMKVSSIPAITPLDDMGRMILAMRRNQPIPWTRAVSSRDLSICRMAAMPVREVNGRFLTTVISTRIVNVPYSAGSGPQGTENMPM